MKNTRPALAAAIAVSAALLFSGCASGGATDTSTSAKPSCDTLRSDIRDINNGAQNTLAGDLSTGKDQAERYFAGLTDRVSALDETWSSNSSVSAALATLGDKLGAAQNYIDTVPTDGTEPDADALATATGAISDAAAAVNDACAAK